MQQPRIQSTFLPAAALEPALALTMCAEPESLTEAIHMAVARAQATGSLADPDQNNAPAFQPLFVMRLLCYCYACHVYSSRTIEKFLSRDAHFREACGGMWPNRFWISGFRRKNLCLLQQCLASALTYLAQGPEHFGKPLPNDLSGEARQRLSVAERTDRMESMSETGLQEMFESFAFAL